MAAIRRPLALAAAIATAATSAALCLPSVATAAPAAGTAAPKVQLKNGTLDWGVKESFRKYVKGMAHGDITAADGARQAPDNGPFTFTDGTGTYDMSTHAVATTFKGSVRFTSKAHGFDIKLADLKVATKGTSGAITADVTAAGKTQGDVALASLDLSAVRPGSGTGGAMTFAKIPVKLTAKGAEAFNGMYKEGQELDPATLTVTPEGTPGKPAQPAPGGKGHGGEDAKGGETGQGSKGGKAGEQAGGESGGKQGAHAGSGPDSASGSGSGTGSSDHKPAAAPASTPAASGKVLDGTLDWGVKQSFREYITGPIAHGKAELAGGAVTSAAGYRFPKGHGTYDAAKATLAAQFNGSVRFTGHEGVLDLKFSNLKVTASGTKGTLIADVSAKARATGKVTNTPGMAVADLKIPAGALTAKNGVVTLKNVPATLTAAGSKAFDAMYKPGQALDPVTAAVTVDPKAQLPDGGDTSGSSSAVTTGSGSAGGGTASFSSGSGAGGSLAATGATVPTGALAGVAGALIVAGGAATYAVRRRTAL
ncbi:HtaA domain-containing protein [Streptomyces chrestomyceticus]|uniref:HtaA domain-containing protein n=1 Tax=Streptomyces chrestomyceticus TaxID=68185 RepID=UPI0019D0860E|nr:HtaA domain-containing protein [Streptomyces chrestomyceticus]